MKALDLLLKKSSAVVGSAPFLPLTLHPSLQAQAEMLTDILGQRNGFYAFASALHVYGSQGESDLSLSDWNAFDGWREEFGELADDHLFFAEDVYGGQFSVTSSGFHHFNIELGETRFMGRDAEEWAATLISDYGYWTGFPIAYEWQGKHGPLSAGYRLFPKCPFVLGGDYEVENLWAGKACDALGFYGYIARRLFRLPNGSNVELELPNGKVMRGVLQR